jgi:hypothetical protein
MIRDLENIRQSRNGFACMGQAVASRPALPDLGALPMAGMTPNAIRDTLRKVEAMGKGDTLRKAKTSISQVFNFAIQEGIRDVSRTGKNLFSISIDFYIDFFLKAN